MYALLAVSILAVLPLELMTDQQDDYVSFFEGENEKEKENEKEENEKEKEKREKNELKEQKAKKFLYSSKNFEVDLIEIMSRTTSLQSTWDPPALTVFSPPPELMLL